MTLIALPQVCTVYANVFITIVVLFVGDSHIHCTFKHARTYGIRWKFVRGGDVEDFQEDMHFP
jgi:hypothetical protein